MNDNAGYAPPPRTFCRAELAVRLLRRRRASTFIDVGCGDGYLAERLAKSGLTGLAIDPSPDAIEAARERMSTLGLASVELKQSDLFDPDLPAGRADAVLFTEVLEHLEDDMAALLRLRDLVREGGLLVLSVPAHQELWDDCDKVVGHVRRYERDELTAKLRQTGWRPALVYNYGFPMINLLRSVRALLHRRRAERQGLSDEEATLRSGLHEIGRSPLLRSPLAVYGRLAAVVQRPFLRTDLGEGYLVLAEKQPIGAHRR